MFKTLDACENSQKCQPPPPTPPPPTPAPPPPGPNSCDLAKCTCDGVDLAGLKALGVVTSGPDAEGYSYKVSICQEIPAASLPSGCQQYAEHPAIVKFKTDNPADCIEIGSTGPCSNPMCGMTGVKTASGVDVKYTYTYGCKNTFTLSLVPGNSTVPGTVTSNECSYSATWNTSAMGPPPPQQRCVNNTCVATPAGTAGMDNQTCASVCGPVSPCLTALISECAPARTKGGDSACMYCAGTHQADLHGAGCSQADITQFCAAT
eukprot:COSAG05_NODE_3159_length_2278_cov_8.291877_1_plen_263_part_00